MRLFNIFWKIAVAFIIAGFSVFIMSLDNNFEGDSAFISFWIFIGMLVVLHLRLSPDIQTIEEQIANLSHKMSLKEQLTGINTLIDKRERKKEYQSLEKARLSERRQKNFNRISNLRKVVTQELKDKNETAIFEGQKKNEEYLLSLEKLESDIEIADQELTLLYKKQKQIESKIAVTDTKKAVLQKKRDKVFKV